MSLRGGLEALHSVVHRAKQGRVLYPRYLSCIPRNSRIYLLRNGALAQLTKDRTFLQSVIDNGTVAEDPGSIRQMEVLVRTLPHEVHLGTGT